MACEWPLTWLTGPCAVFAGLTADAQAVVAEMATDALRLWTFGQFGLCDVTLRPVDLCDERATTLFYGNGPYGSGGYFTRGLTAADLAACRDCGVSAISCGCTPSSVLRLPGPVHSVTSVTVDGAVLTEGTGYGIAGNLLVRLDGASWPPVQDTWADPSLPMTFEIVYRRGQEVPAGGRVAAATLACELAKALTGDASCRLPQRVQTVTRQGVSVAVLDAMEGLDSGRTGIWAVDAWVASVTRSHRGGSVHSPDAALR